MTDLLIDEILDAAADCIARYGWQRGHLGEGLAPHCAVGAICEAVGGNALTYAVRDVLDVAENHLNRRLIVWNDSRRRTASEVITALRESAQRVRDGAKR